MRTRMMMRLSKASFTKHFFVVTPNTTALPFKVLLQKPAVDP
jgi:hypothetical protein